MLLDVLQILVPSAIGVVAPILLFLQSRASANREAEDRQLERKSEEQRRAQELEAKKLELESTQAAQKVEAYEAARKRERDRYLRFLAAAQEVGLFWKGQQGSTIRNPLTYELQSELANSYEDVLLSAPMEVQAKLTEVKGFLDQLANSNIAEIYNVLQGSLMGLREVVRAHLDL